MTLLVVLGAAVLTYCSRVLAVVALPPPTGTWLRFVERIPAPLFAGLAVVALLDGTVSWPDAPALWAVIAAVAVVPARSLAVCLAAGLLAAGVATVIG